MNAHAAIINSYCAVGNPIEYFERHGHEERGNIFTANRNSTSEKNRFIPESLSAKVFASGPG
jgi:hypothetical protein